MTLAYGAGLTATILSLVLVAWFVWRAVISGPLEKGTDLTNTRILSGLAGVQIVNSLQVALEVAFSVNGIGAESFLDSFLSRFVAVAIPVPWSAMFFGVVGGWLLRPILGVSVLNAALIPLALTPIIAIGRWIGGAQPHIWQIVMEQTLPLFALLLGFALAARLPLIDFKK